ncbi:MAG: hypothetical protein JWQ74_3553 [Marmoricola sp.]|nr:hypothetical protein [Marmoricola sp.]
MNAPLNHKHDLPSLAREALSKADGKTEDAIAILDARLKKDSELRKTLISEAVLEAARQSISIAHRNDRAAIVRSVGSSRAAVEALAGGIMRGLLDFPLMDGTKLRDASKDDLAPAISHYQSQAATMTHRARWLVAIEKLVPAQGRVGDVVDEATAVKLYEEAGQ